MRVVHVISGMTPANGGPPVALAGLAKAQVRAGLDVTIVATWRGDPNIETQSQLERDGIRVSQVGPAVNPMSRHPETAAVLEEHIASADVVHVHAVWEQIQHLACRAAQARGVPYVFTPHGMLDSWNMSNGWLKKRLYLALRMKRNLSRAAAFHVATQKEGEQLARWEMPPPIIVEPFGLWRSEFESLPAAGAFRARYPRIGAKRIVLFLGRLDYGKGLEVLIPAFAQIADDEAFLAIVGPDSHSGYRATVEKLIDHHALRDRTVLTGMLQGREKLEALVDAHVLCQPSFHENFGLVVIEALACGTPVAVSDQVYLHSDVEQAGVGVVCRAVPQSVAGALRAMLHDPEMRPSMAARARDFALSRYDWDAIGRRWVGHYEKVVTAG